MTASLMSPELVATVHRDTTGDRSRSRPAGEDWLSRGILAQVGGTPLIRLRHVAGVEAGVPEGVEVHAKAEHLNPSGSVKDRAALAMLLDGHRSGALAPGKTILDATSGNTGIAYAMIGAALGYPVTVCLPANASAERKRMLGIYGCDVVETDPLVGH